MIAIQKDERFQKVTEAETDISNGCYLVLSIAQRRFGRINHPPLTPRQFNMSKNYEMWQPIAYLFSSPKRDNVAFRGSGFFSISQYRTPGLFFFLPLCSLSDAPENTYFCSLRISYTRSNYLNCGIKCCIQCICGEPHMSQACIFVFLFMTIQITCICYYLCISRNIAAICIVSKCLGQIMTGPLSAMFLY